MTPPFQRPLEAAMKTVVLTALIALAAATVGHAQQGAPDGGWPPLCQLR